MIKACFRVRNRKQVKKAHTAVDFTEVNINNIFLW